MSGHFIFHCMEINKRYVQFFFQEVASIFVEKINPLKAVT